MGHPRKLTKAEVVVPTLPHNLHVGDVIGLRRGHAPRYNYVFMTIGKIKRNRGYYDIIAEGHWFSCFDNQPMNVLKIK